MKKFDPIIFLATGFGIGWSPIMPGTLGTLLAIPLYLILEPHRTAYIITLILMFFVGWFICSVAEKILDRKDPPEVVWDEMLGYLLVMLLVPAEPFYIILGFVLFRLFDIVKPWPIRWLERTIPGGLGIIVDDIAAAFYARVVMSLLLILFSFK